jgi:hypothetical protein
VREHEVIVVWHEAHGGRSIRGRQARIREAEELVADLVLKRAQLWLELLYLVLDPD